MFVTNILSFQVLDLYQQPNPSGAESPPQLPASKASPPSTKRIPSSPLNKKSPNSAPTQPTTQPTTKAANPPAATAAAPAPVVTESSLDNQPIPKLITTNETVHYSYASSYGAIYAQQQYHGVTTAQMPSASVLHATNVQNNMYSAPNQYTQPAMPPTLQTANLPFQQSNPAAAYYQPPPPPSRNYYHGP